MQFPNQRKTFKKRPISNQKRFIDENKKNHISVGNTHYKLASRNRKSIRKAPRFPESYLSPEIEQRINNNKNFRKKESKFKKGIKKIFFLLVLMVMLVGGIYYYHSYKIVEPYKNLYLPNIYVNGINLSGKSFEEGQKLVHQASQTIIDQFNIDFTLDGFIFGKMTSENFGIVYDENEVDAKLKEAWHMGREGHVFHKKNLIEDLKGQPKHFSATSISNDTSILDGVMSQLSELIYIAPIDATVVFTPKEAEPFFYSPEVQGKYIETFEIKELIISAVEKMESTIIPLEYYIFDIQPEITKENLGAKRQLRAAYETPIKVHTVAHLKENSENRFENIKISIDAINDAVVIIQPGKTFSFNKTVGRRTADKGYLEAIEYINGKEVPGIGGGVCQTSTTVYMTAVRSGMSITERKAHSLEVNYVEKKGQDATVFMEGKEIDLKFKNTSNENIYLRGMVYKNKKEYICRIEIYGESMNGVSYDIITTETPIEPPENIVYEKDFEGRYVKYKDQNTLKVKAKEGVKVDAFLVTYDEHNIEVDRKFIYTDIYKPQNAIYYIGIQDRP